MHENKRFSGRQLTIIVVAIAVAIIAFPVGVWAVGSTIVTIADPTHTSRKAHVSSSGRLLTTVDGTVNSRPAPPAKPWQFSAIGMGPSAPALGPVRATVNITSLTATVPSDGINLTLTALYVPLAATDCSTTLSVRQVYQATDLHAGTPLTPSFGTPLQVPPKVNRAVCLEVVAFGATISLSGYLA